MPPVILKSSLAVFNQHSIQCCKLEDMPWVSIDLHGEKEHDLLAYKYPLWFGYSEAEASKADTPRNSVEGPTTTHSSAEQIMQVNQQDYFKLWTKRTLLSVSD